MRQRGRYMLLFRRTVHGEEVWLPRELGLHRRGMRDLHGGANACADGDANRSADDRTYSWSDELVRALAMLRRRAFSPAPISSRARATSVSQPMLSRSRASSPRRVARSSRLAR